MTNLSQYPGRNLRQAFLLPSLGHISGPRSFSGSSLSFRPRPWNEYRFPLLYFPGTAEYDTAFSNLSTPPLQTSSEDLFTLRDLLKGAYFSSNHTASGLKSHLCHFQLGDLGQVTQTACASFLVHQMRLMIVVSIS